MLGWGATGGRPGQRRVGHYRADRWGWARCGTHLGSAGPGAAPGAAGAAPPPAAAPGPVAGVPVVVLDPGHNGGNAAHRAEIGHPVPDGRGGTKPCNTTGTATDAGYPEHAFNFDVAQRTERVLEAAGVRVVLTRPNDVGVGPCVDVRGTAGQRADAAAVVAIHADGAAPSGSGFHVALAAPPLNPAQAGQARALGTALHDALRGAGFHDSTYLGERGISLAPRPRRAQPRDPPGRARRVREHAQPGGSRRRVVGRRASALRRRARRGHPRVPAPPLR